MLYMEILLLLIMKQKDCAKTQSKKCYGGKTMGDELKLPHTGLRLQINKLRSELSTIREQLQELNLRESTIKYEIEELVDRL